MDLGGFFCQMARRAGSAATSAGGCGSLLGVGADTTWTLASGQLQAVEAAVTALDCKEHPEKTRSMTAPRANPRSVRIVSHARVIGRPFDSSSERRVIAVLPTVTSEAVASRWGLGALLARHTRTIPRCRSTRRCNGRCRSRRNPTPRSFARRDRPASATRRAAWDRPRRWVVVDPGVHRSPRGS